MTMITKRYFAYCKSLHTNNLRVTPNACRFYSDLNFVFTVQWFSLGVTALSHLNWALELKGDFECSKNILKLKNYQAKMVTHGL
ncbi:hypothetical protein VCRA2121O157_50317 [Vibrio crassostreae]|nr:hypothetical protein VCRA2111O320_120133 [Vibrio crassostreae]CAK1742516.1 hypothetical protein VCRA2113O324_130002 [Vibrio crassostreae]CAK2035919.1 hypothetical protein VCRA2113O326_20385 [Vibrio crassostreae]CAK2127258.1 hypothetical protein VCRA2113O140_50002 [Vibrio crassostreae]CAK2164944.1 hypothetical protein VCRA2113O138_50315 [Vibrio crassostreae]